MFDLLLESSHRDDSNKEVKHIGFGQEIMELAPIEVYFTHVIWSSDSYCKLNRYTSYNTFRIDFLYYSFHHVRQKLIQCGQHQSQ